MEKISWKYLEKEDMQTWAKNIQDKKLFYQLQSQCLQRRPMLKTSYESLKSKYEKDNHSVSR